MTKNSDEELAAKLKLICVTSHPISNVDIDRTFEMLEVLDFHFGITEKSQAEWPWQKKRKVGATRFGLNLKRSLAIARL